MMKKVLIIEDNQIKIEKLLSYFAGIEVTIRESYHSGLSEIKDFSSEYEFLILDMSIPLWEKGNADLGGNNEQFGGERILREMKRRKKLLPTILLTMFDVFPTPEGNLTFSQLNERFMEQFPLFYKGAVFYNASDDTWKVELNHLIETIVRR